MVVMINATMAKHYFPRENPIGKQIYVSFTDSSGRSIAEGRPREIVGVVADAREFGAGRPAPALMYIPHRQHIRDYPGGASGTHLSKTLFLRTSGNPLALTGAVRRAIAEADRTQVVTGIWSMEKATAQSVAPWRFYVQIFGILSSLAITLAAVGIYGVMSYTVSRRTHEIGVRMALGASSGDVLTLILKHGLKLTVPGMALGLAGALALTRFIANMLYGVPPIDLLTFAIVSLLLIGIGMAACYVPARRATSIDPVMALRNE
jgi:putative ABC transport system permease protein